MRGTTGRSSALESSGSSGLPALPHSRLRLHAQPRPSLYPLSCSPLLHLSPSPLHRPNTTNTNTQKNTPPRHSTLQLTTSMPRFTQVIDDTHISPKEHRLQITDNWSKCYNLHNAFFPPVHLSHPPLTHSTLVSIGLMPYTPRHS